MFENAQLKKKIKLETHVGSYAEFMLQYSTWMNLTFPTTMTNAEPVTQNVPTSILQHEGRYIICTCYIHVMAGLSTVRQLRVMVTGAGFFHNNNNVTKCHLNKRIKRNLPFTSIHFHVLTYREPF